MERTSRLGGAGRKRVRGQLASEEVGHATFLERARPHSSHRTRFKDKHDPANGKATRDEAQARGQSSLGQPRKEREGTDQSE